MPSLDALNFLWGFLSAAVPIGTACVGFYYRRRKARLRRFHNSVNPILNELRNALGQVLTPDKKRVLLRESIKLASQATFRTDRPPPDPESQIYANQEFPCTFCDFAIVADDTGSCPDCGLGARHWKAP